MPFEEAEKELFSKNESFENLRRLYDEFFNGVMQGKLGPTAAF